MLLPPVAKNVGVTPLTGLLKPSLIVIVIFELAAPSAEIGLVPVIVDVVADGPPAVTVST